MASVWLVTEGDYSDYRVLMAFATKELADDYVQRWHDQREGSGTYGDDLNAPEEVALFTSRVELPLIYWSVSVSIQDDQIGDMRTYAYRLGEGQSLPEYEVEVSEFSGLKWAQVSGPDREQALRILREWVANHLAEAPAS